MVDFKQALDGTLATQTDIGRLARSSGVALSDTVDIDQVLGQVFTPQLVKEGVGQGVEEIDTDAIDLMWSYAVNGGFNRIPAAPGDLARNVTKWPCLFFPNGNYVYGGPGLSFEPGQSSIVYMRGQGHANTRISLPDGSFLIDSTNNPVFFAMTGFHIEGGKGGIRWKSTAVNANRGTVIEGNLFSNYTECAYSSNSQDFPYQYIDRNCFVAAPGSEAIGVAIAGLTAGSVVSRNIFQRNRYHMKLAPVVLSGDDKGPATPLTIEKNDFIRITVPTTNCFDIWIVPNQDTSQNAGRGINIGLNKFGNESLTTGDARILIAGEGAGTNISDKMHATTKSTGFVNGVTSQNNNYNFLLSSSVPMIYTYTGGLSNFFSNDQFDNATPKFICEYDASIGASDLQKQSSLNLVSFAQNISAASGNMAPKLTNLAGTWNCYDPFSYAGEGSVPVVYPAPNSGRSVNLLTPANAAAFSTSNSSISAIPDSAGNAGTAAAVTVSSATGAVIGAFTFASIVEGEAAYIEFELQQGALNSLGSVKMEVRDNASNVISQRVYELQAQWRFFRLPMSFLKTGRTAISIRFIANDFASGTKEQFRVGRVYSYHGARP